MVSASRTCTLKELSVWWSLIACSRLELLNSLIPNLITMNCPCQEQSDRELGLYSVASSWGVSVMKLSRRYIFNVMLYEMIM